MKLHPTLPERHAIMDNDQHHAVIHVGGYFVHIYNNNNINPAIDRIDVIIDGPNQENIGNCTTCPK